MYISYWHFENQDREYLVSGKNDCFIKDKNNHKYYYTALSIDKSEMKHLKFLLKDLLFFSLILMSIPLAIYCFYQYYATVIQVEINSILRTVYSTIFLLGNIVCHELGHLGVMKAYGRSVGKVRFQLNFIFPTILVDTTDSYMLPKYRRLFVYLSGVAVNIYISTIVTFLFPTFTFLNSGVLVCVIANLLPIGIIKTDGYHSLVNIFLNKKDFKNKRNLPFAISQSLFIVLILLLSVFTLLKLL